MTLRGPRTSSAPLARTVESIETAGSLDRATRVGDAVSAGVSSGRVGSILRGEWLGHPLHPPLTDVPIGVWTSSFGLDVVGGRRARSASQTLIGLGLIAAVPTAAAGWADYRNLPSAGDRRVAVVHAASNASAVLLYAGSWQARRRGHHLVGVSLGAAAGAVASFGAFLGGHLAFGTRESDAASEVDPPPPSDHSLDGRIGA